MRTRIKNILLTGLTMVLVSSLVGCFYYRRIDDDHHHHYPSSSHRW
jgi:hypothetical protein